MKQLTAVISTAFLLQVANVEAKIWETTGDVDIGISRDVLQSTIVCSNADVQLRLMELVAEGRRDQGVKHLENRTKAGECVYVPTQSITVLGVKMAKISGAERKVPSVYVLVKVAGPNFRGYVGPSALLNRGFDIIKDVQKVNKSLGAPLVQ
ncbi:hypothetical protein [Pseudomonas guariconensis]|uniref:hypothetical protein n=1 Tax=Pseudomonas guariconensis TaxID=1288410 RepID=UPI00346718F7